MLKSRHLLLMGLITLAACRTTLQKSPSDGHSPKVTPSGPEASSSGLNLTLDELAQKFTEKLDALSPSPEMRSAVLTQLESLKSAAFDPPTKIEIMDKAIFALDLLAPFTRDRDRPYLDEFLKGAHFVVEDNGQLFDEIAGRKLGDLTSANSSESPLAHQRSSSHYRMTKLASDISFQAFPVVSELLVGKARVGDKTFTWFQTEGHPVVDIRTAILHTIDYLKYKLTGRNIGFYGDSEFTDSKPIRVIPTAEQPDFSFAVAASEQARDIAVSTLMDPRFDMASSIRANVEALNPQALWEQCEAQGILYKALPLGTTSEAFFSESPTSQARALGALRTELVKQTLQETQATAYRDKIMAHWGITDDRIRRRLEAVAALESRSPTPPVSPREGGGAASTDRTLSPRSPMPLTPTESPASQQERVVSPDAKPPTPEVSKGWFHWLKW